jgi:2,3-bisphosphoglycerate-dependent phosphoglycerate mutase
MKSLFLIRHGKASLDGSDRERGLTDEGIEHAKQISDILLKIEPKIQKIFSSPLRRAILTIEPFSQATNLEINVIEDLHEKITGDTEGRNLNEEKKKMWEDFDSKLPGGESSNEATQRALSGLNMALNDLPENGSAAVQCHGTLIALILHNYDPSFGFDQWKSMTMPDIYQINYDGEKAQVIHIGCENIETFKIGDK